MNYFAPNYNKKQQKKKETFMEIFAIISDHVIGFFQNFQRMFFSNKNVCIPKISYLLPVSENISYTAEIERIKS